MSALLLAAAVAFGAVGVDVAAPDVAELVADLSAPSRAARVRAERALIELGPAAAGLLPAPGAPAFPTRPAAVAALERVRTALAARGADAGSEPAGGAARVVPAELPAGTVGEVLAALAERTGNRLDPSALPPETLAAPPPAWDLDTDDAGAAPFWAVLNALAAGRFAVGAAPDGALQLFPPPTVDPAVTHAGVVRIEVGPAAVRPRFGAGGGALLRVPVRLIAEPRVRAIAVRPRAGGEPAGGPFYEDPGGLTASAGGAELAPFTPGASRPFMFTEGTAAFDVDFLLPDGPPPASVTVGGTYEVEYSPGERRFLFAPGEVGESRTAGGVTVRLDGAARAGESATAAAAVLYDADAAAPAFESYQTWRYAARVRLRGPGGVVEPDGVPRTAAEGPAAVATEARFPLPPRADWAAYRIEVVAPAAPITQAAAIDAVTVPAGGG